MWPVLGSRILCHSSQNCVTRHCETTLCDTIIFTRTFWVTIPKMKKKLCHKNLQPRRVLNPFQNFETSTIGETRLKITFSVAFLHLAEELRGKDS